MTTKTRRPVLPAKEVKTPDSEPRSVSRADFLRQGVRALFFGAVAAMALPRPEPVRRGRGYGTGSYGG